MAVDGYFSKITLPSNKTDIRKGDGIAMIVNGKAFKSDFRMVIYGPAVNPRIVINDQVYQILDVLETSEHVVIDSKHGTIEKTTVSGQRVNAFDMRNTGKHIARRKTALCKESVRR